MVDFKKAMEKLSATQLRFFRRFPNATIGDFYKQHADHVNRRLDNHVIRTKRLG